MTNLNTTALRNLGKLITSRLPDGAKCCTSLASNPNALLIVWRGEEATHTRERDQIGESLHGIATMMESGCATGYHGEWQPTNAYAQMRLIGTPDAMIAELVAKDCVEEWRHQLADGETLDPTALLNLPCDEDVQAYLDAMDVERDDERADLDLFRDEFHAAWLA